LGAQKVRTLSLGSKSDDPFSYFVPIFTPVMQFQWQGPNTAVTRPVDRLWELRAPTTCVWYIISQQRCEIELWFQRTTYRKLRIRSTTVTWLITSRDPKRSRSWPQNFWSSVSQHGRLILTTNRKPHLASPVVTWPMTSRDLERSKSWARYLWNLLSQKPCEIDGLLRLITNGKPHIRSPMVTYEAMTPLDPERSRSWLTRYLWRLISQQPCEIDSRFIQTTYRKSRIASPMVTWAMTSRDPQKDRGRDPNIFEA